MVAQTLLVLPLWKPESRTAASLQEVSHKSQHRRGTIEIFFKDKALSDK